MVVADLDVSRLLSREKIIGMAPDHPTARGADDLARSDKWGTCGWRVSTADGDRIVWAEFPDGKRAPIRTTATLPGMRLTCTCSALRFPCRHIIALLLRDDDRSIPSIALPEWADITAQDHLKDRQPGEPAGDDGRQSALVAGMADLQRWLGDLTGQGLALLPKKNRALWLDAANRLVDAYAYDAARELRALSLIPGSSADWPERLLPRMGRLALLCEAFRRLDELSPAERGDALAAAGQLPPPDGSPVEDDWLVMGHGTEIENRQLRARTWLYGLSSRRWALLSDSYTGGRLDGIHLPTGATASGGLTFLPSAWPSAARPAAPLRLTASGLPADTLSTLTINGAIREYAAALAANPWLAVFPVALGEVWIEPPGPAGTHWRLRDRGGWLLPLDESFAHGWRLLSLSADRPLSLFGEWDGAVFSPVSAFAGGWQAMSGWRGVA